GMAPLGCLVMGAAADVVGVVAVLVIGGTASLASGLAFAARMGRWRDEVLAHICPDKVVAAPPAFPTRTDLEGRGDVVAGLGVDAAGGRRVSTLHSPHPLHCEH